MSTSKLRTLVISATMIVAAGLLVAGCSTETIVDPTQDAGAPGAPALPSQSTMMFDLDFFGVALPSVDQQSVTKGEPSGAMLATAGDRENWINAFVRAIYVQLITFDTLEEPIAAFALAIHSVPQEVEPGTYLWTYIFVDQAVEYSIFLYGTPSGDSVDWRMEVSSNNPEQPLDHFVWFDGTSNENDSGFWQFYEPINETDGVGTARIDWANPTRTESLLNITVNGVGHEDEGDYLHFHETALVGTIDHYDASKDELANITWYADGAGSLTVPDYNGGAMACWDTTQRNTDCP